MEILKEPLLAFISLFLSTLVGWLFGRRKQQAETQTTELDNVDKAIHIYRQMIDATTKILMPIYMGLTRPMRSDNGP